MNTRIEKHMPSVDITVERARAFKHAKRHGYLVKALKILLPVVTILAVLSAVAFSKISLIFKDTKVSIGQIKVSTENLTMVNPKLDGFTKEGGKYSVTAAEAVQEVGKQDEIQLKRVRADLTQASSDWAKVTAPTGLFHVKEEVLDLSGDIDVTSSNGMKAFLTEANIFVKTHIIESRKPVRVEMLNGSVRADEMTIDAGARTVLFRNRVRVIIKTRPEGAKSATAVKAEKQ